MPNACVACWASRNRMRGSLTISGWRLGALIALGAAACDPVDHSVGAHTTNEAAYGVWGVNTVNTVGTSTSTSTTTTTGAAGATAEAWSEDILRECPGGTPNVAPTCGGYSTNPVEVQYSLVVVIDQSLAMTEPLGNSGESRWEGVKRGLVNLYRDYDSLVGNSQLVLVFSNPPEEADSCQIGLTVLPADTAADQLEAVFQQNEPTGTLRPLAPALSVALSYLAVDPPPPDMLIVLITAGAPDACAEVEPLAQLTAMAESNLTAIPDRRLPTYVIELGSETLDGVAEAGGTVQAASITEGDVAAQVEQAVRNALGEVRFSEYCTFANPFGDDAITNLPALIGPSYAPLEQEQVPLLDGPEACDASPEGGYYLLEDVPEPTFRYCPCSCARFARFRAQHTLTYPAEACMQ